MKNVELKARLRDFAAAEGVCRELEAEYRGEIHQVDTYFRVPAGRLKLRVNEPGGAELVHYRRPDREGPKVSDYVVEPVNAGLAKTLLDALEAWCVVDKVRTLYIWKNVRIHLDRVEGLGEFMEFEAVLSTECDGEEGLRRVEWLQGKFGIAETDRVSVGYSDLKQETVARD